MHDGMEKSQSIFNRKQFIMVCALAGLLLLGGVLGVSAHSDLQNAEKQLAPYHFAKCNQCYLVNLRYVRAVQNDMVQVGEDRLEISRRQRAAFLAAVAAYVGGAM